MANQVFNRKEKKYLLSIDKYNEIIEDISKYMQLDTYGIYTVYNIYYDTNNYQLIRKSISKPTYKEKLRLRSYGPFNPDSVVFLELKKKFKGVVNKRRIELTLKEAYDYLNNGIKPNQESQILNEINYFVNQHNLKPVLYLAYDRMAFRDINNKEFRITFDCNIRSRNENVAFEAGDYGKQLLDFGYILMEIKSIGSIPLWLVKILSKLKIYPISFSKYGNIYKQQMLKGVCEYV